MAALSIREPDKVPVWIHAINEIAIANIGRLLTDGVPEPKAVNLMSDEDSFQCPDLREVSYGCANCEATTA
jgi:rRNA processing protein Krr1/Pno1